MIVLDIGYAFVKAMSSCCGSPRPVLDSHGRAALDNILYQNPDGSWLIGFEARQMARIQPDRSVREYKSHLGTNTVVGCGLTARDAAEQMARCVAREAASQTNEASDTCMLLCPVEFNEAARADVVAGVEAAGFKVIGVITEPAAALIAALDERPLPPGKHLLLCVDGGALTFDVTLVEAEGHTVTVLASEGVRVGGSDLTRAVESLALRSAGAAAQTPFDASRLRPEQRFQLDLDVEEAKVQLSVRDRATVPVPVAGALCPATVERAAFEAEARELLRPAADCVRRVLDAKGVKASSLAAVVYAGGPFKSPFLRSFFDDALGVTGLVPSDPSLAGVKGGFLHGCTVASQLGFLPAGLASAGYIAVEVMTRDIGVSLVQYASGQRQERCHCIVKRWTRLPYEGPPILLKPESPNQREVTATFLQGAHGSPASDCVVLGTATLPIEPEAVRRSRIELRVGVDRTGLATITVRDIDTDLKETVTLKESGPDSAPDLSGGTKGGAW